MRKKWLLVQGLIAWKIPKKYDLDIINDTIGEETADYYEDEDVKAAMKHKEIIMLK